MLLSIDKKYLENYHSVCNVLKAGGAMIIATDSVYAIVAKNPEIIYKIKKRDLKKN